MGQVERILTLYQRLMDGRIIDKSLFAMEFGTTERSIERDILAIRLFLSESYSSLDLVYDRAQGGYRMDNLRRTYEIGEGECFLLSKMLLKGAMLREDEQDELVRIILFQVSDKHKEWIDEIMRQIGARTIAGRKRKRSASLKLIEDLLFSIEKTDQITLHFENSDQDKTCVPFSLEIADNAILLIAFALPEMEPIIIRLDDISSYSPARKPYLLHQDDTRMLQALSKSVADDRVQDYSKYVYKKESGGVV